jgi:hypothetical protein
MMGAFWLLIYPNTPVLHGWIHVASSSEKSAVFVALTAVIAFILNACSSPLYRILEGYLFWPRRLQLIAVKRQRRLKKKLEDDLTGTGWERGLALEKLAQYPLREDQVVPTRFGNALRSFETYGKTRFNLDSQTLWYELNASAPKYIQTEIDTARSSVDFFVAMTYLSFLFSIVTLLLAIYEHGPTSIFVASAGAFGLTLVCHRLGVRTTVEWGYSVQALVNLARIKLAEGLGLQIPETLEEEKVMWGLVTSYVFSPNPEAAACINRFRKKNDKSVQHRSNTGMPGGERSDANGNLADESDGNSDAED